MGQDIIGEEEGEWVGTYVSLSGDGLLLAVGSMWADANGVDSGRVKVWRYHSPKDEWIQVGPDLAGESAGDTFGVTVALSGDGTVLAGGAHYNQVNGGKSGHARVFQLVEESEKEADIFA